MHQPFSRNAPTPQSQCSTFGRNGDRRFLGKNYYLSKILGQQLFSLSPSNPVVLVPSGNQYIFSLSVILHYIYIIHTIVLLLSPSLRCSYSTMKFIYRKKGCQWVRGNKKEGIKQPVMFALLRLFYVSRFLFC